MEEKIEKTDRKEEKGNIRKEVFAWIRLFVIAIAAVIFVTHFVIINAKVPSGSMESTIMTGDRLIGFRLSYTFSNPERGDIILFKYPIDEDTIYIKRVIGLPGETVEIRDGNIYIDGSDTPLEEDYLPEEWITANDGYYFIIPENSYLVLGDNRNNSLDSRYWADEALATGLADTEEEALEYSFVSKDKIIGKALFTYYSEFKNLTDTAE